MLKRIIFYSFIITPFSPLFCNTFAKRLYAKIFGCCLPSQESTTEHTSINQEIPPRIVAAYKDYINHLQEPVASSSPKIIFSKESLTSRKLLEQKLKFKSEEEKLDIFGYPYTMLNERLR